MTRAVGDQNFGGNEMMEMNNFTTLTVQNSEKKVTTGGMDENFDDDGRPKRTGTTLTGAAHIITAVIGSGVLSLPWCVAQLGWVLGPIALFVFSILTYFTSGLLADCYRSPDPVTGKRNYSYMEAVGNNLGSRMRTICGITQYINIIGYGIGYAITTGISMYAIYESTCMSKYGNNKDSCKRSVTPFVILFGVVELVLSQIPNIHELTWLSTLAAVMSFLYAGIGVGFSIERVISGNTGKTTLIGLELGPNLSVAEKTWSMFSALGDIEVAFSFAFILIEIQDTMKAPAENKKMKKANLYSVTVTSIFYALCGCIGYAAYGVDAPGNMLTGVEHHPLWLVNFANVCIIVHICGAYQVFSQPLFAAVENYCGNRWETSKFIRHEYSIPGIKHFRVNLFRLVWRSLYVAFCTIIGIGTPFFNEILALLGATGYWPLTIYFPIAMYISQRKIKKYSVRWTGLQLLNLLCLLCAIAAALGAIQGIIKALGDKASKSKN